jgi:putative transposase
MAKPYSMDLRERAVAAVEQEGMSRQGAALRFGLAPSTVITWVQLFRAKGDVSPGQMGGHKPKAISGEHRDWLIARCQAGDFTLRGLVDELASERGLKVDYHSVWDFVHAEGLSYKKNPSAQRAGSPRRRKKAGAMGALPESD